MTGLLHSMRNLPRISAECLLPSILNGWSAEGLFPSIPKVSTSTHKLFNSFCSSFAIYNRSYPNEPEQSIEKPNISHIPHPAFTMAPTFLLSAGQILAVSLLFWLIRKLVAYWSLKSKQGPYPPGPSSKPLVGNFFDLPKIHPAIAYVEWGKQYHSKLVILSPRSFPLDHH
jgi:hypothetical protein